MRRLGIGLLLAALLAPAALANDSVAERAVGGLVLKQSRDIDMLAEHLFISAEEVRVRYVFRNRSARPIRTLVAFPLPDRDLSPDLEEGDTSWPTDFQTRVDGRPVRMQVERRVFARGVDHTALLRRLNVPIGGEDGNLLVAPSEAIDRLPRAQQRELERHGLIVDYRDSAATEEPSWVINWTVRESWYWEQVFPPGRDLVVEHRYRPAVGGTVTTGLTSREYREGEGGRYQIARYCIDAPFLRAVDRLAARPEGEIATIGESWLSYILTTGANWRSPIGEFTLVIDKGRPDNLVSFCGEGVRRISPTQFEMRRRNWRPDRDLNILILNPYRADE